jgi:hypothetical protein
VQWKEVLDFESEKYNIYSNDILNIEGPIWRTREGGSEWEPIKLLLEGDGNSN